MIDHNDAPNPGQPTGPRSEEGKAASSANAITHGMTARKPLCEEEAGRMRAIVEHWTSKQRPETPPEEALIASAAIEYVRYLRCVDGEEARLGPGGREAVREWREKRRHAARRQAQGFRDDPGATLEALLESSFGIDWMLRHWRVLLGLVESGRGWRGGDLMTAMHLLGLPPMRPSEAESEVDARFVWDAAVLAFPAVTVANAPAIGDPGAAEQLRAFLLDRIARLESIREAVWEEVDAPEARAVETAALLDTSKEGQLRQRYRREALRDMHRSLSQLSRLQVERSKTGAREARLMWAQAAHTRQADAPAWTSPSRSSSSRPTPAPVPTTDPDAADPSPPGAVEPRNEPPDAADSAPGNRRNPLSSKGIRNEPPGDAHPDDRRTVGVSPAGSTPLGPIPRADPTPSGTPRLPRRPPGDPHRPR